MLNWMSEVIFWTYWAMFGQEDVGNADFKKWIYYVANSSCATWTKHKNENNKWINN
jgi:hypothetical protein